jgi:dCTP deaminase
MGVLADWQIRQRINQAIERGRTPMIRPATMESMIPDDGGNQRGKISAGLGSYGYDMRLGNKFQVFQPSFNESGMIDPKNFNPRLLANHTGDYCVIPANSFALGESVEEFNIPRDVLCLVIGKSTYARCGIIVNVTPLEPEWRGKVTIEISNTTPLPAKVYAGEGIAQLIFIRCDAEPCEVSYADKKGRYQDQQSITLPKV